MLNSLIEGLKALVFKGQRSLEIEQELRTYLDAAVEEKIRRGMTYDDALHASQVEIGSLEAVKEQVRCSGWESALESLWKDARYGFRQFRRNPGFSTVVILTLLLGIGANTAIFTVLHAVMFKRLPITDPQSLYRIGGGIVLLRVGRSAGIMGHFRLPVLYTFARYEWRL